jgi:hypothetical protein
MHVAAAFTGTGSRSTTSSGPVYISHVAGIVMWSLTPSEHYCVTQYGSEQA